MKMKILLKKIWIRLICGKPRQSGNYSVYWGKADGENYIFEVSVIRSFLVDKLCPWGSWASHPVVRHMEDINKRVKKILMTRKKRLKKALLEIDTVIDDIEQHSSYASSPKGLSELSELLGEKSRLMLKVEKLNREIKDLE